MLNFHCQLDSSSNQLLDMPLTMSVRCFQRECHEEQRPILSMSGSPDWIISREEKANWMAAAPGLSSLTVAAMPLTDSLVTGPHPRIKYQSYLQLHNLTHVCTLSITEKSWPLHPWHSLIGLHLWHVDGRMKLKKAEVLGVDIETKIKEKRLLRSIQIQSTLQLVAWKWNVICE